MCYNIIQYREFGCGHRSIVRRQMVDCNRKRCRFSGMHETEMHHCELTCVKA
ncbi:hypothetical protein HD554DRAFT_2012382 [Boletus coccyginus]|nr:hypothetical protein HD554DRAFT_2012382 [Boletus coccyginus]